MGAWPSTVVSGLRGLWVSSAASPTSWSILPQQIYSLLAWLGLCRLTLLRQSARVCWAADHVVGVDCSDTFCEGLRTDGHPGEDGPSLSHLCFLDTGLKSMLILVLMLGQFSLATTVSVTFLYTAELFPTILRYGVWWARKPWRTMEGSMGQ